MSIKQVFDASALLSLSLAGMMEIIRKLEIEAFVPPSVLRELERIEKYKDALL
jgi:predicted DNA-binding protein (UPF0278 family)